MQSPKPPKSELEKILPTSRHRVMDLVKEAGIDVSNWTQGKGGTARAASNPKFCYEWAFQSDGVIVLNLWHDEMREEGGEVFVKFDLGSRSRPALTGVKATRWARFHEAIERAVSTGYALKVVVNAGTRLDDRRSGREAPRVKLRLLDPKPWRVAAYDREKGTCELRRGGGRFVDQFHLRAPAPGAAERRMTEGTSFVRSPSVRLWVLERAKGRCELCDGLGFQTSDGRVYLETHHVRPLSDGGSDSVDNVVALCPNDHRRAHHAENRKQLGEQLFEILRGRGGR